jgi:hypothetical protein
MIAGAQALDEQWRQYLQLKRNIDLHVGNLQGQLDLAIKVANVFLEKVRIDIEQEADRLRWSDDSVPIENWFSEFETTVATLASNSLLQKIDIHPQTTQNLPTVLPSVEGEDSLSQALQTETQSQFVAGPIATWREVIKRTTIMGTIASSWIDTLDENGDFSATFSSTTSPFVVPVQEWLAIFELGSWTTEGPSGVWGGP